MMDQHVGKKEKLDGERDCIELSLRGAGGRLAQNQVNDARDQQESDGGPRDGFEAHSALI